jgi:hypothetical protein
MSDLSALPPDIVRMAAPVRLMFAPTPEGRIDVGLLIEAPPPIGAIWITLGVNQIDELAQTLGKFIALDDNEFHALRKQLHERNQ